MSATRTIESAGTRVDNGIANGQLRLPSLIGVATLAGHLGLTERTIRRKVAHGEIPHYKLGNSIRFDPVEIHEWLSASRVDTGPQVPAGARNGTRP